MIEYRKGETTELEALLKARMDFLHDGGNAGQGNEPKQLTEANKTWLKDGIADGSLVFMLALDGDNIAATGSLSFCTLPPNNKRPTGKAAYIGSMFTYPAYRGRGIATALFARVVDEARQKGCEQVILNATEMGRPIYAKYGFKPTGDEMVYYLVE